MMRKIFNSNLNIITDIDRGSERDKSEPTSK